MPTRAINTVLHVSSPRRRVAPRSAAMLLATMAGLAGAAPALAWQAPNQPPGGRPPVPRPDAPPAARSAIPPDEPLIPISAFRIEYGGTETVGLPPVEDLLNSATVTLTRINEGIISGKAGPATLTLSITELNNQIKEQTDAGELPKFSKRAVIATLDALVKELNRRQVLGVFYEVSQEDLSIRPAQGQTDLSFGDWNDLRPEQDARTELSIKLFVARVTTMRTVASGGRLDSLEKPFGGIFGQVSTQPRVNNENHAFVLGNSPVKAGQEATDLNLLRRDELDDYVFRLNRHPGRRVDVGISADEKPATATLDFLVRESDPLLLYFQFSNTGTRATSDYRERFGLIHSQLLGFDDTLSLDYVTGQFDTSHIFNGSYEIPISDDRKWKVKAYGSYSEFDASEVGFANERFNGNSWFAGGEISYNIFQSGPLFIDLAAGARYQNIFVNNRTVQQSGETSFFLPTFGARLDRGTDTATTNASIDLEFNLPDVAGTKADQLVRLGRLDADDNWAALKFNFEQTLFLEPIFDARRFDRGQSTLAHEVAFQMRGQTTFDRRVAPNFQQVAGGLYTVRGYPESIAAGDSVIIFTGEYRLHVPRLYSVKDQPGELFGEPFRWSPQVPYGRPDWDLILRAFIDAGYTRQSDKFAFERNDNLVGAGVGFEVLLKRNLNFRGDWGIALRELPGQVKRDAQRFHFVLTLLY